MADSKVIHDENCKRASALRGAEAQGVRRVTPDATEGRDPTLSGFRVTVSAEQVAFFRSTWPGCTLEGPLTFEYAPNGDLVDIDGIEPDDVIEHFLPAVDWENESAQRALSYDAAKGYGKFTRL